MNKKIIFAALLHLFAIALNGQAWQNMDANGKGHYLRSLIGTGRYDQIPAVIAAGANLNLNFSVSGTEIQTSLLSYTTLCAPTTILRLLLDAGADLGHEESLMDAVHVGMTEQILPLLPYCHNSNNVLQDALQLKKEKIVQILLDRGAHLDSNQVTQLSPEAHTLFIANQQREMTRINTIVERLETYGNFPRDLTRFFWDIAGLPLCHKPSPDRCGQNNENQVNLLSDQPPTKKQRLV